ncbi:Hypothetical predicted protein, partial [Olea europaea subsp. europaea]
MAAAAGRPLVARARPTSGRRWHRNRRRAASSPRRHDRPSTTHLFAAHNLAQVSPGSAGSLALGSLRELADWRARARAIGHYERAGGKFSHPPARVYQKIKEAERE